MGWSRDDARPRPRDHHRLRDPARDGKIESGERSFASHAREGEGARFLKFQAWLHHEIGERFPDIDRIVYEEVIGVGPGQAYAARSTAASARSCSCSPTSAA
jgi:hypothetical protein